MNTKLRIKRIAPDTTAVRVALWRVLHAEVDSLPHVLEDETGLKLAAPSKGWRSRPDMKGHVATGYHTGIVIRARFVEDLVTQPADHGIGQYVILGAGLDTFAQRKPEVASRFKYSRLIGQASNKSSNLSPAHQAIPLPRTPPW